MSDDDEEIFEPNSVSFGSRLVAAIEIVVFDSKGRPIPINDNELLSSDGPAGVVARVAMAKLPPNVAKVCVMLQDHRHDTAVMELHIGGGAQETGT